MKAVIRSAASLALLLLLPTTASAHFGGSAFILVTADHVRPGEPFEVVVADLAPGSRVTLEVRRDGRTEIVGETVSDTEGHFSTSATLPADYPDGYTELVATARDGTSVATWVLVGPRDPSTAAPPTSAADGGGLDPSIVVLGLMVGGAALAAGYLLMRRNQPAPPS